MPMKQKKIFISTSSFGEIDDSSIKKLEDLDFKVNLNPHGRKLSPSEIVGLAKDHDALIAGTEDLSELVKQSESIKLISRVGVGLDAVPLALCKSKNIKVTYTPEPVVPAVAELTLGFILNSIRSLTTMNNSMRNGSWKKIIGKEINECVIGIIGFGNIGYKVAELLSPFNPKEIIVFDTADISERIKLMFEHGANIRTENFKEILAKSDILTLHLPLNSNTHHLISENEFKLMKKNAYLINTSRGGIVDENSLYNVVQNNNILGAALDVFEEEPYSGLLLELNDIHISPHIGSYTSSCRMKMEMEAVNEVLRFFNNEALKNEVPESLYMM
jgi:D-3-phosphoglycerate dehydrogenase / 2-oxoglutarate reductase